MILRNLKFMIMSVTANISSEIQVEKSFTFQNISKRSDAILNDLSVLEILEMCQMLNVVESTNFNFPNFPETNKTFHAIYFKINPSFSSLKGLFKGMVSLGKPLGVIVEYISELEQFTLKYYESDKNIAKSYINKFIENIEDEIRFKSVLNTIIENQRKIKSEESLLLQKLFA
ncbi:hypothetical protein Belba_2234 [Belliella baltica DSM 15883]|uniref:Uncharacterized protein n=2 Tax=Belliella TaxID=232244 RepID=I3Z6D2_BELBD|nr:hypothetical protein Belba_2234 [Belliella baltica DSM 15883]